jgi:hypothetical protein
VTDEGDVAVFLFSSFDPSLAFQIFFDIDVEIIVVFVAVD